MTRASLSFGTEGLVRLCCPWAAIDETRPLDASPPFEAWASEYTAAQDHPAEERRLLELGCAIGAWLEGPQAWLTRLLKSAPPPLILEIETSGRAGVPGVPGGPDPIEHAALDAPWELIAQAGIGHLALHDYVRLSPVRRLDLPGGVRPRSRGRLSVLFMAAQPRDVTTLDFEREEAQLTAEVGKLGPDPFDLFVEETGTLDGLAATAQRAAAWTAGADPAGPVDVIHVSCHGAGGDRPGLLLEDEVGDRVTTTGAQLAHALAANVPALAVVAACSTAEDAAVSRSLAAELCMGGWPAALGWSGAVDDGEAAWLAARLYHKLAQRAPLTDALAWCRRDASVPGRPPRRVWHQARLFLGRSGGGPIAGGSAARRPARPGERAYLDRAGRVPVARDDEFVGRRRAVQRVLAALRGDAVAGAVIHGAGQLGKSSLAAQVSHHRRDLQTVVIARNHDAGAILAAIASQAAPDAGEFLSRHRRPGAWDAPAFGRALRELLEGPCSTAGAGAILLVLDGLEPVLVPPCAPATHAPVRHELAATFGSLIDAFRGARTASRLLFTSRHRFVVLDEHDLDLTRHLWHEPLGVLSPVDLAKRVRASIGGGGALGRAVVAERAARHRAALELCQGNPGLLQILLAIIDRVPERWPALCGELRACAAAATPGMHGRQDELVAAMARVALARLAGELDPDERELVWLLPAFETHTCHERGCRSSLPCES
jgi:CHAT domain-containing protein